jgi:hypothetical protein
MLDIPSDLLKRLYAVLNRCGPFSSYRELQATFIDNSISQWRDQLPRADNPNSQVSLTVDYLCQKYNKEGVNALILFLRVLVERVDINDDCHRRLNYLVNEFEKLPSVSRPCPSIEPQPQLSPSKHTYTFENREDDLRKIFSLLEVNPYLHIFAPSGTGKTYLVEHLHQEHYLLNPWSYIDFSQDIFQEHGGSIDELLLEIIRQFGYARSLSSLPILREDLITVLTEQIRQNACYGIVVLDNVDHIASSVRRQLREEVLPTLQKSVSNPKLYIRFIAIAQKKMEDLSDRTRRVFFQSYCLEAFSGEPSELRTYKNLLRQAVARFGFQPLSENNSRDEALLNEWAVTLFNLTGGHPGAITRILNYVGQQTQFVKFVRDDIFVEMQHDICEKVLTPLLEQQVEACLSLEKHQAIFQQLWVFRYLSNAVFRQLLCTVKEKPYWSNLYSATSVDHSIGHALLWGRLTETPLLQSKGVRRLLSHQLTPIWRKLGNLVLRNSDSTLYAQLHSDAREVFDYFASKQRGHDPGMRVDCFVERLYHHTQVTTAASSERARYEFTQDLLNYLDDFLRSLKDEQHFEEYVYNLNDLLISDRELQLELNSLGQSDTLQQLSKVVMHHTLV